MRLHALVLAGLGLAGMAQAQEGESRTRLTAPSAFEHGLTAIWSEPAARYSGAGPFEWLPAEEAEGVFKLDPLAIEEIIAQLAPDPPPISREHLDGPGEELLRFRGLPGGIVLGRAACPTGGLAESLEGARLEGCAEFGLVLRLADGRGLRCPQISPAALRALLAFIAEPSDSVVSLGSDKPKLALAFADTVLASLLVRMDGVPHALLPETRCWKSLIVDLDVRFAALGDDLRYSADLEVRFYWDEGGSGRARRARTLGVPSAQFVGPRLADDLSGELAPLAEITGWLGFLRWLKERDPVGLARLRASGLR